MFEKVQARARDIRTLSFHVDLAFLSTLQDYILSLHGAADKLVNIEIHVSSSGGQSHHLPHIRLPVELFPSLRSLTLDGVYIHESSAGVIRQLHALKLWNCPARSGAVHPNNFMPILRNAVSLHTLHFNRFLFAVAFSDDDIVQRPLQLPCLNSLICEDAIHSIRQFFQEVDIGPHVHATIIAHLPRAYEPDPTAMYGPVRMVLPWTSDDVMGLDDIERMYSEPQLNPNEEPVEYGPVGWIFPSDRDSPTLLKAIKYVTLSRNSNGEMELVGTSDGPGELKCIVSARSSDSPLLKYHLMSSALCTISAHLAIQRETHLQTLNITAELDFISPTTWRLLFHATPHLTDLHLHDTGRFIPLSVGALIVFGELSSPIAAPRLQRVTLRGSMVSVRLIEAIHATLASRRSVTPTGQPVGILESLGLDLLAIDAASAKVEAIPGYSALVKWVKGSGTKLTMQVALVSDV